MTHYLNRMLLHNFKEDAIKWCVFQQSTILPLILLISYFTHGSRSCNLIKQLIYEINNLINKNLRCCCCRKRNHFLKSWNFQILMPALAQIQKHPHILCTSEDEACWRNNIISAWFFRFQLQNYPFAVSRGIMLRYTSLATSNGKSRNMLTRFLQTVSCSRKVCTFSFHNLGKQLAMWAASRTDASTKFWVSPSTSNIAISDNLLLKLALNLLSNLPTWK